MDDMKAMMQEELRQALVGLMPPPAPAIANLPAAANPPAAVVTPAINPPIVDAPPSGDAPPVNNDNAGGNL